MPNITVSGFRPGTVISVEGAQEFVNGKEPNPQQLAGLKKMGFELVATKVESEVVSAAAPPKTGSAPSA